MVSDSPYIDFPSAGRARSCARPRPRTRKEGISCAGPRPLTRSCAVLWAFFCRPANGFVTSGWYAVITCQVSNYGFKVHLVTQVPGISMISYTCFGPTP